MLVRGTGYTLANMDVVARVDAAYPHAVVESDGCWYAEENPRFREPKAAGDPNSPATVFSADAKYYAGLIPALFSFMDHHPDHHVVVIDRGLSPMQVRYLQQFCEVVPSRNDVAEIEAWGRFEVSLLPYRRVVFLDSDIIVLKPLKEMYNTMAEFAAVRNLDWKVTENFTDASILRKYHISPDMPAFFAGGFSIDNMVRGSGRLLREANRIYQESGSYSMYGDQSALQIIMYQGGRSITYLPDEYNAIAECWDRDTDGDKARVIHYAGDEIKPWNPACHYPKLEYLFAYSKIQYGRSEGSS